MKGKKELFDLLDGLGIAFVRHEHPAVSTVEEARLLAHAVPGAHFKNLFLKDLAGRLFLVVVPDHKPVDLKGLARQLGCRRLSFASPDALASILGILPGAVSPLALFNDEEGKVEVVLDADLLTTAEVSFHPLVNSETITLATSGFLAFLSHCGHKVVHVTA